MGKKNVSWSEVKGRLKGLPGAALLGVIQDLYELAGENREFLAARFLPERGEAVLGGYRRRVVGVFDRARLDGPVKFAAARKAIKDYEAATSDVGGTLDLMLTLVESGNALARDFGDIDEAFYDAVLAMMERFARRLEQEEGRPFYERFAERLEKLDERSRGFGWGYSDAMGDILAEMRGKFEKE